MCIRDRDTIIFKNKFEASRFLSNKLCYTADLYLLKTKKNKVKVIKSRFFDFNK